MARDRRWRGAWRRGDGRALVAAVAVVLVLAVAAALLGPLDQGAVELERNATPEATDANPANQDGAPADGANASPDAADQSADGFDQAGLEDVDPSVTPSDQALDARLDAYLDGSFSQTRLPGVAVAVVDTSGTVYERTLGDIPDASSPVLIGSLSKSFTAVCVMQLVEEGCVSLDAPAAACLSDPGNLPDRFPFPL